MNRYLIHKLLGLALLVVVLAGCNTASVDPAEIISPDGYPVATFTTDATSGAYAEGDTIMYTVTIDKQIDTDISFSARVVGGDASDADLEVATGVIEAYTSSTDVMIVIAQDTDIEETESATIEFGAYSVATRYLLNPSTVNPTIDITIDNFESNALDVAFFWDIDVEVNPNYPDYPDHIDIEHTGSEMDFDFFTTDFSATAFTGSHPEEITMAGLDDGTYIILCELWANHLADSAWRASGYGKTVQSLSVPITAHFVQAGVQDVTVVQDPSQVFTTDSLGVVEGGTIVDTYVATVEVATSGETTTYTITNNPDDFVKKSLDRAERLYIPAIPENKR